MEQGRYDLHLKRNATNRRALTFLDDDGTAIDLTGYTAAIRIRKSVRATDVALTLTSASGRITFTPLAGKLQFDIDGDDWDSLPFESGTWSLDLTKPSGEVDATLGGAVLAPKRA